MKRFALFPLLLGPVLAGLLIGACTRETPLVPAEAPTASSSLSSPTTDSSSSASSLGQASSAASTGDAPEQLSETEGSATSLTSTSSLALKMTQAEPAPASRWQEGVHYTRLSPVQPTSATPGQIEVTEVFWYGCPHCYALDPYLESWRKSGKADYVSFVRVPVMWSPGHKAHARMFYTAQSLGRLDDLHDKLFREMQVNKNPLNSASLIETFFLAQGVAKAEFDKAFSSFAVESSLARAEALGLRYKVESVPLIVINGKFVSDVGKAGGQQQLIALINDLSRQEHGD